MFIDVREVPAGSGDRACFYKKVTAGAKPLMWKDISPEELAFVDLEPFEYRRGNHSLAYGLAGFNMAERLFAISRED